MKRNKKRIIAAVAVICALAAGGAAFTNSITGSGLTGNTAGYAAVSVHGAVLSDATYTFSSNGSQITDVTLHFTGDLTGDEVKAGFSDQSGLTDCGAVTAGEVSGGNTTVDCTLSPVETTANGTSLNVLVSNN